MTWNLIRAAILRNELRAEAEATWLSAALEAHFRAIGHRVVATPGGTLIYDDHGAPSHRYGFTVIKAVLGDGIPWPARSLRPTWAHAVTDTGREEP